MAKNDWKKNKTEDTSVVESVEVNTVEESAPEVVEEPAVEAPQQAPGATPVSLVDLGTYARLSVEGYKEHWWHSIERYARSHGLKTYKVSEEKAKEVLTGWGAKLK